MWYSNALYGISGACNENIGKWLAHKLVRLGKTANPYLM